MVPAAAPLPHPYVRPPRSGAVPLVLPFELKRLLDSPEPPVLVDVRPEAERELAHLPADVPIPLSTLPQRSQELPRSRAIVVYCQFGNDARRAVRFLLENGFDRVTALEGGIDEYARTIDPTIPRYPQGVRDRGLLLQQFPRSSSGCLAYLVGDPVSREAVVIDPGVEVEPYLAALKSGRWRLAAVIETHTHADHLAGHSALHQRTDAPILLSRRSPAQYPHRELSDGASFGFGGEEVTVLETPGHTRDHLTLKVRDKIFTGDTLLVGSCGRTDLGDGSPELLWESLTEKLLKLPPSTEVLPAHFGSHHALVDRFGSTIGFERATNEALRQPDRTAFLRYMTEGWPPKPADFDSIVRANLDH